MTRKQAEAKARWYERRGMKAVVWAVREATALDLARHHADPDGHVYACATPETRAALAKAGS